MPAPPAVNEVATPFPSTFPLLDEPKAKTEAGLGGVVTGDVTGALGDGTNDAVPLPEAAAVAGPEVPAVTSLPVVARIPFTPVLPDELPALVLADSPVPLELLEVLPTFVVKSRPPPIILRDLRAPPVNSSP